MNSLNDNIHTVFGIVQDKKVCIQALGRGAHLKSKLLHKLTITENQSIHLLCVCRGKWGQHTVFVLKLVSNIMIFAWATGMSLHSMKIIGVWEAEQYHLDVVGVSSTKCCVSDTVELNESWKLCYSSVDVTMCALAGVGIFVSPCLAHSVTDWIPLRGQVCLLKLRLQEQLLCM